MIGKWAMCKARETTVGRDKGRNRLSDDAVAAKFGQSTQGRLILRLRECMEFKR